MVPFRLFLLVLLPLSTRREEAARSDRGLRPFNAADGDEACPFRLLLPPILRLALRDPCGTESLSPWSLLLAAEFA